MKEIDEFICPEMLDDLAPEDQVNAASRNVSHIPGRIRYPNNIGRKDVWPWCVIFKTDVLVGITEIFVDPVEICGAHTTNANECSLGSLVPAEFFRA